MISAAAIVGWFVLYCIAIVLASVLGWHMEDIIDAVTKEDKSGGGQMPDPVPKYFD